MRRALLGLIAGHYLLVSLSAFGAHGRTTGSASVSADGAADYSVPLWAPPSIGSLSQSLALRYASTSGSGHLGVGWSVSAGLSVIQRCSKSFAQDGTPKPVELATSDGYCLDGNRLRLTSGTYGAASSKYQTEFETYSRITANSTAGNGPASFTVERADGLIAEYGVTADSRVEAQGGANPSVRTWAINKLRDRVGNSIQFVYAEDTTNRTFRISEITYPHIVGGGGPTYKIQFVYQARAVSDTQSSYVAGGQSTNTQLIDRIDISYNNASVWELVRKYELTYETAPETSQSRLTSLTECSPSDCYSPSSFTYQNGSTGWQSETSTGIGVSAMNESFTIDVSGDGKDDLVFPSGGTYRIAFSNGAGFSAAIDTAISSTNSATALPIDFNSDGRADLLIMNASSQWRILQSNGTTFTTIDLGLAATGAGGNAWVADYDGDGREDLLYVTSPSTYASRIRGRKNTGSTFSSTEEVLFAPAAYEQVASGTAGAFSSAGNLLRSNVRIPDFDGDGRADALFLIRYDRNEGAPPANWQNRWRVALSRSTSLVSNEDIGALIQDPIPADINGDGFADIAYPGTTKWTVRFGNGVGGFSAQASNTANGVVALARCMDFDGDGRADLLTNVAGTWYFTRYNGTGFDNPISLSATLSGTMDWDKAADVNGDGLLDHVYVSGGVAKFRFHNGQRGDLLTGASDGFGITAAFTYSPLTNSSIYTRYTTAAFPQKDVQTAKLVVSQLTRSDGTGGNGTYAVNYTYEGGRIDLQGRGWLAFAKRTSVNGAGGYNVKTIEAYRQDFPYAGLSLNTEVQKSTGTKIGYSSVTWASHSWGAGDTTRRFPYISSSATERYEIDGSLISTTGVTALVDTTSGLPYDVTTTVTEATTANGLFGTNWWKTRAYSPIANLLNDATSWCLGRPQHTLTENSHSLSYGALITRTTDAQWDSTLCRPTQVVAEPGGGLQVTNDIHYDGFGNIDSVTTTGASMTGRQTQTGYGTRGFLPETVTNALVQTTATAWDYKLGVPTSKTDPNGIITNWEYDTFGRRTREVHPDNTRTTWTYEHCSVYSACAGTIKTVAIATERDSSNAAIRDDKFVLDKYERPVEFYQKSLGDASSLYSVVMSNYDSVGRLSQQSPPVLTAAWTTNYFTTYGYDLANRPTQVTRPISAADLTPHSTVVSYQGLRTIVTDSQSITTTKYANAIGQLVRTQDHSGYYQDLEYDSFGDVKRVLDSLSNILQASTYNIRGMLTSRTDMDMGPWSFTPNALGELISQTDANSQTTTFAYDPLGRPTTRTEDAGTTVNTWTWGTSSASKNIGRLQQISKAGYVEAYAFDSYGRPSTTTITADSINYLVDYSYNNQGRLHTLTYPTSTNSCRFVAQYGYTRGTLSSVTNASNAAQCGTTGETYWVASAEDGFGQTVSESFGNTVLSNRAFDRVNGWLNEVQSGSGGSTNNLQNLKYTWDKVGNLKTRKDDNQSGLTESFFYDNLYRLDYSQLNGVTNQDLSYDALGNILSNSLKPDGITSIGNYTYHATKKHQVVSTANGWSFSYDLNGNMTSGRGATFQWTNFNRPYSIYISASQNSTLSYTPDKRYWKQVANAPSVPTTTTTYISSLLEKVQRGGITDFRHQIVVGSVRIIVSRPDSGPNNVYYVTRDHLGSSSVITNTTGGGGATPLVNESFGAFGHRRGANWTGLPTSGDQTAIDNTTNRGFTDHTMMDNLRLIHMNGRVSDPLLGRFISADPFIDGVGNTQGWNRYSYVHNRPLSFVDPSGFSLRTEQCQDGCSSITGDAAIADFMAPGLRGRLGRNPGNTLADYGYRPAPIIVRPPLAPPAETPNVENDSPTVPVCTGAGCPGAPQGHRRESECWNGGIGVSGALIGPALGPLSVGASAQALAGISYGGSWVDSRITVQGQVAGLYGGGIYGGVGLTAQGGPGAIPGGFTGSTAGHAEVNIGAAVSVSASTDFGSSIESAGGWIETPRLRSVGVGFGFAAALGGSLTGTVGLPTIREVGNALGYFFGLGDNLFGKAVGCP